MDEFKDVLDNLSLVDVKHVRGWFTWVNNRSGGNRIKERLDRFVTTVSMIEKYPFMTSKVVRQTQPDHDAIIWDMWGSKPKEYPRDQKLCFRFEECWATNSKAKSIISSKWNWEATKYVNKLEKIRGVLGLWQRDRYGKMKNDMRKLENKIDWAIDSERRDDSAIILREMRSRLSQLYAREEKYWAQRSRSQWLRDGDRNTRYFHARATGRLKKNTIEKLKNEDGMWVIDSMDISNVAKNYFWRLFRSNGQNVENHYMEYIQECVTTEINEWLKMDYTENEVLQAIKQMNPHKAPRVDGLSGSFFKNHWEIVGNETVQFCLDILKGKNGITDINEIMIILIPKIRDPCEITNYHPINLCRFIYKIVSKVLANRLKVALPGCISQNQSAFVLGRMIHNNILIAHELLHYLQSSKNGPNKGIAIKIDMSKAYDRVEWDFIEKDKKLIMKNLWFFLVLILPGNRDNFGEILGMKVVEKLDNYLGLPLPIGKKKRAPRGVLDDIQPKLSRAWWTGKDKGRFWMMLPWKTLSHLKGMGGIGIRDIRLFNLALLGRQVWRLINNKDTLCYKVLSSKYFPDGNIFNSKKVDKASFTWTSIAAVANTLRNGFGWQGFDKGCPRCGAETETVLHALKDCPTSSAVLSIGGWSRSFITKKYDHCIDWLEDTMRVLDKRTMADLMTTLWNYWNNRNNYVFRGKEEEAQVIWERASNLIKEFQICNMVNAPLISHTGLEKQWVKPPKGFIKLNFNATVGENRIGYGTIIRDEEGFVLGGSGGFKE
ncbi:uncharacterized protein [Gossypium hirsutum]|uniref:Reverse transcriptase domain-containing protein n=1 Tax=Gossypium hirsutum TaxID=3635 RepID=A0A1U8HVK3_GOSHI|nr:uncharacterized protein LOC107887625 [Gossypium hirsutum]